MSEHPAKISWERGDAAFDPQTYSRDHTWSFDNDSTVAASAAPGFKGNPACVDPEEAFVASLASCHMLTFLFVAARKKFVVDRYEDEAVGVLGKNAEGRFAITRLTLRPLVTFGGERQPTAGELSQLHDAAHHDCFIATSVKTEIVVEPR